LEIAVDRDLGVPDGVSAAKWLTPLAVAIRYGIAEAPLDRGAAVAVAVEAVSWATAIVDGGDGLELLTPVRHTAGARERRSRRVTNRVTR
jgi:sulfur carrier protein ThiS